MEKRRAVFLDRDGVLNRAIIRNGKPYPPQSLDDFHILPGVLESLNILSKNGFLLIVATNQPDVARGVQRKEVVEAMHHRLREELPLTAIKVCYEIDGPHCTCYKPKPQMLLEAAREFGIDLFRSFMVGDRWRDVECGRNAGCFTIVIERGYSEELINQPNATCSSLSEAVPFILQHNTSSFKRRA